MFAPTLHQINLKRQKEVFEAMRMISELESKGLGGILLKDIARSAKRNIDQIFKDYDMVEHPNHSPKIERKKLKSALEKIDAILRK